MGAVSSPELLLRPNHPPAKNTSVLQASEFELWPSSTHPQQVVRRQGKENLEIMFISDNYTHISVTKPLKHVLATTELFGFSFVATEHSHSLFFNKPELFS